MTAHHDDFDTRYRLAVEELVASNLVAANYDPPLQRILRLVGLRLRPPHYLGQLANVALFGVPLAVLSGLVFWLVPGLMGDPSGAETVVLALLAGALFGWLMARHWRREAEAAGLTPWDDLSRDANRG